MRRFSASRTRLFVALAFVSSAGAVQAQTAPTDAERIQALSRRLDALERSSGIVAPGSAQSAPGGTSLAGLDQRLRVLERRLELQEGATAAKAEAAPSVALSAEKGLSIKAPGDGPEVKFRALIQGDGRLFFGDDQVPQNDTFLLRRVEPTIEGSWGKLIGFRLNAQFAGDSATINDAYIDLRFDPRATLRVGKTKTPVGLERLQSSGALTMVEQGFPAELAPGRDVGIQLQGELAGARASYALGVYNGAVDGRDGVTTNPDNDLEVAARLFFEPWKNNANALSGLGFGVAASSGDKHGAGNHFLPRYRTPGQATFFGYRGPVLADGRNRRWSPQAYWYRNAFGLLGECIRSEQAVATPEGVRAVLDHRAWQVTGSYVLTGEDASYRGVTRPNHPFALNDAGWGAFELVARYGRLDVDDNAFPVFADPASAASAASAWGLGLNWYLTGNLKLVANYTRTRFDGGADDGADREDESGFFTRAQLSF